MHRYTTSIATAFAVLAFSGVCQVGLAGKTLTKGSIKEISGTDFDKMPSGCSFAALRGKKLVAIMIDEDYQTSGVTKGKARVWFKIDGRLRQVTGEGQKDPGAYTLGVWTGEVLGFSLRIVEGRRDPNFQNVGGGIGGWGRIEWHGVTNTGSMPIRWEAGC